MFAAVMVLFILPWLDTHKTRSAQFRPYYKQFFWLFFIDCLILGWVGSMPAEGIYVLISRMATGYYFLFFLVILPILSRYENTRTIPTSIAASVLSDKFGNEKTSTENI